MKVPTQPTSLEIYNQKYQLKDRDGTPLEKNVEETFARVARALSNSLEEEKQFYEVMLRGCYPAGRIVANAGAEKYKSDTSLINCTVSGDIEDSLDSILDKLHEAGLTLKTGAGIGYCFSTLRPRGDYVSGAGASTSGPLSFMDIYDAMCFTISSAGGRRGAQMGTMHIWHPDIMDFITAKQQNGRLRQFNLSVLVTDDFMKALENDEDWTFKFGGKSYHSMPAKELWNKLIESTYNYSEPGVIFIDRMNNLNPLNSVETISATNPCVTGDTWVHTDKGAKQVTELIGKQFTARVDGKDYESGAVGFFYTGTKSVLELKTEEGYELRATPDHLVAKVGCCGWVPVGELKPGDEVLLNDHRDLSTWVGQKTNVAITGFFEAIERASSTFHCGFFESLFDSNGLVHSSPSEGLCIKLAMGYKKSYLTTAQRMLLRLGIKSSIEKYEEGYYLVMKHDSAGLFIERIRPSDEVPRFRVDRENFTAKVKSITYSGVEPVYDVQVPGINAFDANGFYVHNCGEQGLPPYGACLLGSVDLTKFVDDPFTGDARINYDSLYDSAITFARLLDNVADVNRLPLKEQRNEILTKRRHGMGITGLGSALAMLRTKYGSYDALPIVRRIAICIAKANLEASITLAEEKGPAPIFEDRNILRDYINHPYTSKILKMLPVSLQDRAKTNGFRYTHSTSIAPRHYELGVGQ